MSASAIAARIDAQCAAITQVFVAEPGGNVSPVAAGATLRALLSSSVSGRVYPVTLPDNPAAPNIVYQIVSSAPGEFEGYQITQQDRFVLNIRGTSYDALLTLFGTITTALASANMQITDRMDDWDESRNLYRINLEILYTYLNAASQTLPAAFVYPLNETGGENLIDAGVQQRVQTDYAIVLLTASNNMTTLRDQVRAALLGWQIDSAQDDFTYQTGANIQGAGPLEVWREVYSAGYYIREA